MKRNCCVLFCAMIFLMQVGCGKNSNSNPKNKETSETAVVVEVATVKLGDIEAFFTGTAPLETEGETEVVAKVGGVVKTLFVEEGNHVKAGQVLAKLDDEKFSVQVEQAMASLRKLENEYKRSEELFNKNLISTEEFQQTQYDYEYQKAAYQMAKLDLDYTSIRSPISGVIAERMIKVGNMVLIHQPTFRVTRLEPLLAKLYVPERHMHKHRVGHRANLRVDAIQNRVFQGYIKRVSPVVDPSTGTVKVTVEVRDPSGMLKPGMFARINIVYDIHNHTMLIPKDGIITEDKESSVFVVKDSMAYRRYVETGYVNSAHVEVVSGVQPGDTVVTTGKGSLKDSTKVEWIAMQTDSTITED